MPEDGAERSFALPPRAESVALLNTYTESPALRGHALAVEAVMRRLATYYGEDPVLFGRVGLLHDFDYEQYPDIGRHTIEGARILTAAGYPPVVVEAIQSHVTENNIPRDTRLKQAIYAADELTGLVVAVALVKGRNLAAVTPASVMKKLKDKSFARGVNRADVYEGAKGLGLDIAELVDLILEALKGCADELGLICDPA
jgi:putative nucleotidyltransferase with HDIG domain